MGTETWIAGARVATYTSAFGTEINSLANGSSVLSSVQFDNSISPADVYGQISIDLGSIVAGTAAPYLSFGIYPLNEDGTTYGDNQLSTTPAVYVIPDAYAGPNLSIASGVTGTVKGTTVIFPLPFVLVKFKLALYNNSGVALAGSNTGIFLKTLNRQLA